MRIRFGRSVSLNNLCAAMDEPMRIVAENMWKCCPLQTRPVINCIIIIRAVPVTHIFRQYRRKGTRQRNILLSMFQVIYPEVHTLLRAGCTGRVSVTPCKHCHGSAYKIRRKPQSICLIPTVGAQALEDDTGASIK